MDFVRTRLRVPKDGAILKMPDSPDPIGRRHLISYRRAKKSHTPTKAHPLFLNTVCRMRLRKPLLRRACAFCITGSRLYKHCDLEQACLNVQYGAQRALQHARFRIVRPLLRLRAITVPEPDGCARSWVCPLHV